MSQVAPSKRLLGVTVLGASGAQGVWLNRYGYLGDEKLDAVGRI